MKKSIILKKAAFITLTVVILTAVLCFQTGAAANNASSLSSAKKVIIADTDISSRPDAIAAAQGIIPPPPPEAINRASAFEEKADDSGYERRGIGLLKSWNCGIFYVGTGLELFADTKTNYPCDIVMSTVYLQWWDGSQWIDLNSYTEVEYYSMDCMVGVTSPCYSGNYYRARGVHFADDGTTFEEYPSVNNYVYVP